ncbi:MAG: RNA-directed DNA polymerase [Muribaculaceae bacterium]|nr:RNA-directed DNA polymerase [Muribaculaceae bacterium]
MVDGQKLNKNPYRVLLTEVLPYEMPLGFDNCHFFENMATEDFLKIIRDVRYVPIDRPGKFKIPFDYHIRRSGGEKSRKLSLMHPMSQLYMVDFYREFESFLLHYTSLSPFSLRHPESIAPTSIRKKGGVDYSKDMTNDSSSYRNYFTYRKYDQSYKFFDSFEFLNLEKRFTRMRHLDIASCFYHIYTHSICWAVKDKKTAKKIHNEKNIFENKFDSLMSDSNYGETNGIIVGPEISRIFSEIIFQRIDLLLIDRIKQTHPKLIHGREYEIKRYVDDYYVFSNSQPLIEEIQSSLSDVIEDYKLYLNKSKIEDYERPMVRSAQIAKADLRQIFDSVFSAWEKTDYHIGNISRHVLDIINSIRLCIRRNTSDYSHIVAYGLTIINNFIHNDLNKFFSLHPDKLDGNVLRTITEIAFFLFSMDWCPSTSYKLCIILKSISDLSEANRVVKASLCHNIVAETKRCLDNITNTAMEGCTNIEAVNLLITLKSVFSHSMTENTLKSYFRINDASKTYKLDYFQICALLFLCGNDPDLMSVKDMVKRSIMNNLGKMDQEEVAISAEHTCLLLDLMTCPYLDNRFKNKLLEGLGWNNTRSGAKRKELSSPGRWFFDWNCAEAFDKYLKLKEYRQPYD